MADVSPPTAADYAWADAQKAREHAAGLEKRVARLEMRLAHVGYVARVARDILAGNAPHPPNSHDALMEILGALGDES